MLRPWAWMALLPGLLLAGCASQSNNGQGQAKSAPGKGTSITVVGNVAHPVIPWEDGMTLMRAFTLSGYQAFTNPSRLGVIRKNQMPMYMDFQKLYDGQDMMLEPGDRIEINP